jgi:hypothetical protein
MTTRPPSPATAGKCRRDWLRTALLPAPFLSPCLHHLPVTNDLPEHPCLIATPRAGRRCTYLLPASAYTPPTPPRPILRFRAPPWPRRTWLVRAGGWGGWGGCSRPCCALPDLPQREPSPVENTSASAPSPAGAAALLWSYNPALTLAQVRASLLSSVDAVPAFSTLCTTGVSGAPLKKAWRNGPVRVGHWPMGDAHQRLHRLRPPPTYASTGAPEHPQGPARQPPLRPDTTPARPAAQPAATPAQRGA